MQFRRKLLLLSAFVPILCSAEDRSIAKVVQRFEAEGIRFVVVRAFNAANETVVRTIHTEDAMVTVSATPSGGAAGYHPPDAGWQETKASEWGLTFVAQKFGKTLVISSSNEVSYIHHQYRLGSIELVVPAGVAVSLVPREASGSGEPDLSPP